MKHKTYSGYKSFDYLDKQDYKQFELEKEIGWGDVKPYEVPLSKGEEERLERIIEKNVVISLHDHAHLLPKNVRDITQLVAATREGRSFTGYEALSKSCLDAIFDNLGSYFLFGGSNHGWKWE